MIQIDVSGWDGPLFVGARCDASRKLGAALPSMYLCVVLCVVEAELPWCFKFSQPSSGPHKDRQGGRMPSPDKFCSSAVAHGCMNGSALEDMKSNFNTRTSRGVALKWSVVLQY